MRVLIFGGAHSLISRGVGVFGVFKRQLKGNHSGAPFGDKPGPTFRKQVVPVNQAVFEHPPPKKKQQQKTRFLNDWDSLALVPTKEFESYTVDLAFSYPLT